MTRSVPSVTVVTPAFNAEATIAECLASVAAQDLGDHEHLVVDDGSTDDTGPMSEAAAEGDRRIRVLRHPGSANRGRSASRNLAVREARGEVVAFLDADDALIAGALDAYVRAFGENPAAGVVYGQALTFGGGRPTVVRGSGLPVRCAQLLRQLARFNPLITSATAVRRDALPPDPFPLARFAVEDWMLFLDLARRVPFLFVDRPLARYRLNPAGGTAEARRAGQMAAYELECAEFLRRTLENGTASERVALDSGLRFRATSALQLAAAALRRGQLARAREWTKTARAIAASSSRLTRAVLAVPAQQLTVWLGREHSLTLSPFE